MRPLTKKGSRLDIFVSHTVELDDYPNDLSFIEATCRAIMRVGCHPVEMSDFGARPDQPAEFCRAQVELCDVYIAIIGLRYGAIVPDHSSAVSYTEFEFEVAAEAGIPRLIFLLEPGKSLPPRMRDRDEGRIRQFRARVQGSDLIVNTFRTPEGLEAAVSQALSNVIVGHALSTRSSVLFDAPWMVPLDEGAVVDRPLLSEELVRLLTSSGNEMIGVTTALTGAGGFGKTTLAAAVCSRSEIRQRFPGGLLWITLGESIDGADLAGKINDLSERLAHERPTLSDPEQAGLKLAELLAGRGHVLLVMDDVWRRSQLHPFLIGGANCRRLITTRIANILPPNAKSVLVDAMEREEARELLHIGVLCMPAEFADKLLSLTGGWPVLISLVNAALRRMTSSGSSTEDAAETLVRRLERGGPTALDLRRPEERREAVRATVEASLVLLSPEDLDCLLDLAIFPEDIHIPVEVLKQWWMASRNIGRDEVEILTDTFLDLSLVTGSKQPDSARLIKIHDVLRSYFRQRLGVDELLERNASLVDVARSLPWPREPVRLPLSVAWWGLGPDQQYFWRNIVYHLAEAQQREELESLVLDLRWTARKIEVLGSSAWVEADLALVNTSKTSILRNALSRAVHVLAPVRVQGALAMTLVSRLDHIDKLADIVSTYVARLASPLLRRVWPLPDQPSVSEIARISGGHTGWLRGCSVSADGLWIATFSNDQTVRSWTVADGEHRATLAGHRAGVRSCAIAPDGSWLVSTGNDRTVRVWDVSSGALLATFLGHSEPVCSCAVAPNSHWIASTSEDATVKIWDVGSGELERTLTGHADWVDGCAVFPDSSRLATASADGSVRVWDTDRGREIAALIGHAGGVRACAVSPDGELVASAGSDTTVRIWDPDTGSLLRTLEGHSEPVNSCSFAPNGNWLLSASSDSTVRTWNVRTGLEITRFSGHSGAVRSAVIAPSGSWVASAGRDDGTLRIWKVSASGDPVGDVSSVWKAGTEFIRTESEGHTDWVAHCASAPEGHWIATTSADATIRLWDVVDHRVMATLRGHAGGVRASAISNDESWLVSAGSDGTARVWDRRSAVTTRILAGHVGGVRGCAISPDDEWIVTVSNDATVRLWSSRTGTPRATLRGHTAGVRACSIAPSGDWLASAGSEGAVRVWDVKTSRAIGVLEGHRGVVRDCVVSPDERWLASAGADGTIRIWDVDGWGLRAILQGHDGGVRGCAVDATGSWLASVSTDQTLRVWKIAEEKCEAAIRVAYSLSSCTWISAKDLICAVGEGGVYIFSFKI